MAAPSADHAEALRRENLRGAAMMVAAMALFAMGDGLVKLTSSMMGPGQVLALMGLGSALVYAVMMQRHAETPFSRAFFNRYVIIRNVGEIIATSGVFLSLTYAPISIFSAIMQVLPLLLTLAAILFLGETVGWRRWIAILGGLVGMLMIIRPGTDAFHPASLFSVLAVCGMAMRDLGARMAPAAISSRLLAFYATLALVPTGGVMMVLGRGPQPVSTGEGAILLGMIVLVTVAYLLATMAMRMGEVSVITPFRFSRLIFGLIVGIVAFGERPDAWVYAGSAVILASGAYAYLREARLRSRAP